MSKIIQQKKEVTLSPKQFDAVTCLKQFILAVAGIRGGKTFAGAVWAGNKVANDPGNGLITAPDWQTMRDATLLTFFQLFPNYRKFYKEQKHVIELPIGKDEQGNTIYKYIYLRSMDDPYSAEGLTVSWIWADEAGKYRSAAWGSLRGRVSLAKGQMFLTTTPYNMGWLYTELYQPWEKGLDPDYAVFQWDSIENPLFLKQVWEAEQRRLPKAEFDRRYRGRFARMQGLVYSPSALCFVDKLPETFDIVLGGIDWGWTHHAALIVIGVYKGAYYIKAEWYETRKTTAQIIEEAIKLQNKHRVNRWYADSANPEKIAEANANTGLYVLPYEKFQGAINAGIDNIRTMMLEGNWFCLRGLPNIKDELDLYQYPEKPTDKDEPIAENNHLMDSMRYAIMGYQPARRTKLTPVPQGGYTELAIRRRLEVPKGGIHYGTGIENIG